MLEIVLTREDANSESALLAEWLVEDGAAVHKGRPVCIVETSKASIEIESPGDGTLVQLVSAGMEVELGGCIALVAVGAEELAAAESARVAERPAESPVAARSATSKAIELAERHGIDLAEIAKPGFITADDVRALISASGPAAREAPDTLFAGLSTEDVTLPAVMAAATGSAGTLDEGFLSSLRADPEAFAALSSEEKCDAYRRHGAELGDDVSFGAGALVIAPRIVLEDHVQLLADARVSCEEVFAAGELALLGSGFRLGCRRAFVGAGTWSGSRIVVGGGGNRDPWATFAIGELGFIGDEAFVNVCRPVLIGREAFLTMRSVLLTHNVGHSLLEGFENRFAGIVLEDMVQIGVGAVVYAGCRVGREAIVASNSYVVSDIPARTLAVGVPARAAGAASRQPGRSKQLALARRMLGELEELLALQGVELAPLSSGEAEGFELIGRDGPGRVMLVERLTPRAIGSGDGETVVLTLGLAGAAPQACGVLDLLGRRVHGSGGVLLDSVREFCRKRGIRFEPGPWRYRGGFI
jgi:carbonic anhydrase/acetyltransferase-like protein (isoleucine patch superfamily)